MKRSKKFGIFLVLLLITALLSCTTAFAHGHGWLRGSCASPTPSCGAGYALQEERRSSCYHGANLCADANGDVCGRTLCLGGGVCGNAGICHSGGRHHGGHWNRF